MAETKDSTKENTLLRALSGGRRNSVGEAVAVAAEVLADPALFPNLFDGLDHADALVRMRAAYAVSTIADSRPDLLQPYKNAFLDRLANPGNSHLARACMLQAVGHLAIPPNDREMLCDMLRDFMYSDSSIVKTFSMQLLVDFAETDEQLRAEAISLLWNARDNGTPAMRARARKLLKKYRL